MIYCGVTLRLLQDDIHNRHRIFAMLFIEYLQDARHLRRNQCKSLWIWRKTYDKKQLNDTIMIERKNEPLEPEYVFSAEIVVTEWTNQGLVRGVIVTAGDPNLPEGSIVEFIGGIPGERVLADIKFFAVWRPKQAVQRKYAITVREVIASASQQRTQPRCQHFGACGSCRLQHLTYEAQLQWKWDRVYLEFAKWSLNTSALQPVIGAENPWNYRNHMRFSVNSQGKAGLTFFQSHQIIPLTECPIAHPTINRILQALASIRLAKPQIGIRCGANTGEALLFPQVENLPAAELAQEGIAVQKETLRETIGGCVFTIRANSFFQTNTPQAEKMAQLVLNAAPRSSNPAIADAYSGVGVFAALLAKFGAGRIAAIEESAAAVKDAKANFAALGISDVEMICGKVEEILPLRQDRFDAIIIDPPRAGCYPQVLQAILEQQIPHVIYISCDPATLARDTHILCAGGYRLLSAQPLDMFPDTYHIECVGLLSLVKE